MKRYLLSTDAKLICLEVEGVTCALWKPPENQEKFVLAGHSLQQYIQERNQTLSCLPWG